MPVFKTPEGGTVIVCVRGKQPARCSIPGCPNRAPFLCDWKLRGVKAGKTCDKALCASHTKKVAPDKDLCPAHAEEWNTHPANRSHQR